jgi:hypothetical protein
MRALRAFILGLSLAALAGPLAAQETIRASANLGTVQPVTHIHGGAVCHDACAHKVCVPECTTKKHSHTVFSSKCIEYCLPRCSLFSGGLFSRGCSHGCNQSCDQSCGSRGCADNCGPVRTKRVLLKKVVTEECPDTKCVVQFAPACTTSAPVIMAPAERVPAPLPKAGSGAK